MANIDFQNPDELYNKLKELMSSNPDYTAEELWDAMKERTTYQGVPLKDINIASDIKNKLDAIASGQDINPRELLDIEEGYAEQEAQKTTDKENNASFQDLTKEKGWGSKTGQEKLKIFADKYNKLLNETKDYVLDKYSGEGLTGEGREEFLKGLYEKETALKELENSNEFKNLMLDLAEAGTGNPFDNGVFNGELNETLKLAASGAGSEMFKDKEMLNNIVKAGRTSWTGKTIDSFIKNGGWASIIPGGGQIGLLYNMLNGEDAQDIAKEYVNKNGLTRESLMSDEEKEANKWAKFREKNPNVDVKKATDKMLFGDDVAGAGGNDYLNKRDDALAYALKVKGAESPEEIDEFLSQYPSWQNAKQQWKDETLKRLSEKMSNVKYDDFAKKLKDAKAKKETKDKKDKEDKEVFDKDAWVWKTDEDGYWNPNNDSPINGVEDSDKSYGDKSDKDSPINEVEQTPENNKYLYINETVKNIKSNKDRIDYLKKHGFVVDKKTGFFTKNGMKTKVYKDGQYNPKYVKPDKKEGYNDRTKVEPSKENDLQIALQESGYQGPRDANGNFLPITDEWLDIQEGKKNLKDKSKK